MPDPVIVFGATGFIGRALVRSLANAGTPVIAVSRSPARAFCSGMVEPVQLSAFGEDDLRELVARGRAIVHLATTSTPGTSAARPLQEVNTNLRFTAALLQALQARPHVELLYMSSGGALYTHAKETPASETASVRPRSYHGAAKLAAEVFISAWCDQFGGRATILRPSNVYGPGQPERPGFGIIPATFGTILRGEELQIWGDGSASRDYIYIDDLVRLCTSVLARPMEDGASIVNACSGKSTSLNTLLDTIEAITGRQLQRKYLPARNVDASTIRMDPGKAASLYQWRHATDLRRGIAEAWRSHLADIARSTE